jgi:hypothetical protein
VPVAFKESEWLVNTHPKNNIKHFRGLQLGQVGSCRRSTQPKPVTVGSVHNTYIHTAHLDYKLLGFSRGPMPT